MLASIPCVKSFATCCFIYHLMAGPGKGFLKRFGLSKASTSDVPQPHKSSTSRDVMHPHKSSGSRDVPPLHKSTSRRDIPPLHKSSSRCDAPPPQKSSSISSVPQPQKSSNISNVSQPQKSNTYRSLPKRHKSSSSSNISEPNISEPQPHVFNEELQPHPSYESDSQQEDDQEDVQSDDEANSLQEDDQIETDISDLQQEDNSGSTSHGTSVTRKETRALSETRKRRLNKGKLNFEVDECAGRIIGVDSQRFITKGGCVMREFAKFDGTTWKNQTNELKTDIITKCTENSSYDSNCRLMVRAIETQLANQHRNRQYRLHLYYKKFPTTEEATRHPPNGINATDWLKLCQRFASKEFQNISSKNQTNRAKNEIPPAIGTVSIARIVDMKRREGQQVSAIEQYKIAHFSKKKNKMVNDKADAILIELQNEEATSLCSPAEICLKKLRRIPGHTKGRSASTKQILATENLRMELELEKNRSRALEEEMVMMKEEQNDMKEKMDFMMEEISRLSRLQSGKN